MNKKKATSRPNAASSLSLRSLRLLLRARRPSLASAHTPGTMQSTSKSTCAYAACALSILSLYVAVASAHAHHPSLLSRPVVKRAGVMTYQGCFSSSDGLTDQGSWTYQSKLYCQPICVNASQAVLATTGGTNCFCGDVLPPADSKVDDSNCNTTCDGYSPEECTCPGQICAMSRLC